MRVAPFLLKLALLASVVYAFQSAFGLAWAAVIALYYGVGLAEQFAEFKTRLLYGGSTDARQLLREAANVVNEAALADPPSVTLAAEGESPYYCSRTHAIGIPLSMMLLTTRQRRCVVLHETAHALQRAKLEKVFRQTDPIRWALLGAPLMMLLAASLGLPTKLSASLAIALILAALASRGLFPSALSDDYADELEVEADLYAVGGAGFTFQEYDQLHHDLLAKILGVESADSRLAQLREPQMRKRYSAVRRQLGAIG